MSRDRNNVCAAPTAGFDRSPAGGLATTAAAAGRNGYRRYFRSIMTLNGNGRNRGRLPFSRFSCEFSNGRSRNAHRRCLVELRCEYCGEPAVPARSRPLFCLRCWERDAEYQRRWDDVKRSAGDWNVSQDDPWWRDWLTSRELFATYHDTAPRVGERIHSVLGGEIFEYGRADAPNGCWVQVWVSSGEVMVAYPPFRERYGFRSDEEGLHEFEGWIHHLRHSEPLALGQVRGRSSYGASWSGGPTVMPVVKWAQSGDWAALARGWHLAR